LLDHLDSKGRGELNDDGMASWNYELWTGETDILHMVGMLFPNWAQKYKTAGTEYFFEDRSAIPISRSIEMQMSSKALWLGR